MSTYATRDPDNTGPFDGYPSWDAYQHARARELTNTRIRNMRATNRHLSPKEIAYHTGVSLQRVTEVLAAGPP